jgi:hypothetical protein
MGIDVFTQLRYITPTTTSVPALEQAGGKQHQLFALYLPAAPSGTEGQCPKGGRYS